MSLPPTKIVSLVPSLTELVVDLGLERELVGVTKFCVRPKGFKQQRSIIGGTKNLLLSKIAALKPELIIASKEENDKDQVAWLAERFPVWVSLIGSYSEALTGIQEIGNLCGKEIEAQNLVESIQNSFSTALPGRELPHGKALRDELRVIYLIWKDPYMAAGKDTFISSMLFQGGWVNVIESLRYPTMTVEGIKILKPDLLFLSSEPYPFKEKHRSELEALLPGIKSVLVDGEMFSWYGSRMLHSASYFHRLI